ncbi:hypothetical protein A1O7_08797 [Cladophialophora yegresii CBS 114405]|uniref:Alpha-1,3-mannosyltransferase n=1 Tax=Cladophialophora yegresii CBS 114405 TaxID=1182544 RepID=W9VUR1_9EURO|nr:uncharacterized protein A1O7_08797 [Cladophialophora yegresii CBS 114405]EXJ55866.1 hypothetical protein A1O7_08797 [Cladophialophora yegresii CBS 114405]
MPPHLHPRSTATSTLFAGTLLASFIVVGIPHVFPCPRPRTGYAADAGRVEFDEDGKPIRRKTSSKAPDASGSGASDGELEARKATRQQQQQRARVPQKALSQAKDLEEEAALFRELAAEAEMLEKQAKLARECPVPKPRGWVGRILGFEDQRAAGVSGGSDKG